MPRLVAPIVLVSVLLIIGVLVSAGGNPSVTPSATLQPFFANTSIPDLSVTDEKGNALNLRSFPDKTLVNFWNSNCSECKTELPLLDKFSHDHPELKIVLVNYQEGTEAALEALKSFGLTLPTYYDHSGSVFLALAGTMPSSYYLESGKIVYSFPGRIDETHLNALVGAK